MKTIIVYPNIIPALGGAQYVHVGKKTALVTLASGTVIGLPLREIEPLLDDGFAVANSAMAWEARSI